ncbi:MAG: ABC transporter substrate-binding protein [Lachnospiraceae bacterium]|jgi:ABC-type nitrate/sulfonate/bicarbonate transport system substrate-binding protein|nr:ABC transporter substrate-binding protein [Lachnospiraceae bacterium]MEE3460687.1 ABC transporter substrate-binding protein [Lachnospiraceae bacterium]
MKELNLKSKAIKFFAIVEAIVLAVMPLTGCTQTDSQSKKSVVSAKVSSDNGTGDLPTVRLGVLSASNLLWEAQIGIDKGIFKKNGINVEYTEFGSGIESVNQIVAGNLDIGFVADFAGINRIGSTQDKTDLRFIAPLSKTATYALYVDPEQVSKIEDIKGKGVMVALGTVLEYFNGVTFTKGGFTKNDVDIIPLEAPTDVLALAKSEKAAAYWTAGETARKLQEDYGWKKLIGQADIGITTNNMFMANNAYANGNKETIAKFLKSFEEIADYEENNREDTIDYISKKDGIDKQFIEVSLDAEVRSDVFDQDVYDGLQIIENWCSENKFYDKDYSIKDFINAEALKSIDSSKVTYK